MDAVAYRKTAASGKGVVLVGVLKSRNDREILLNKHWYRIPTTFLPKRRFDHLAFYQPVIFGARGKRIEYYGRITGKEKVKRIKLLPGESLHPRAHDDYVKFTFAKIVKLAHPVKNIVPRRVCFGFTTIRALRSSRTLLQLYQVTPTERIVERGLNRLGIRTEREYSISKDGRRYRLDLAVFCDQGAIAIECDNFKAHSAKSQIKKDKRKDAFLKRLGWRLVRLKEKDVLERPNYCFYKAVKIVKKLGGQNTALGLREGNDKFCNNTITTSLQT